MPQKCGDSGFCKRLRGVNSTDAFVINPDSVAVEGAVLKATLVNKEDANGTFSLALTAYADTIRLHIDEDPAKKRFQVPDVLLPSFGDAKQVAACRRCCSAAIACKRPPGVLCFAPGKPEGAPRTLCNHGLAERPQQGWQLGGPPCGLARSMVCGPARSELCIHH